MRPTGHGRARGLVSRPSSDQHVRACAYAPPDDLRDVVAALWMGRWDLRGQPPHQTQLLGDPSAHLVFEAGRERTDSRLVGVWTSLWRRTLQGWGRVRGVKLRPGAVQAFALAPAHHHANTIVPLCEALRQDVSALERAVLDPEADARGFAVLCDWLRAQRRPDPSGRIGFAVALAERIANDPEITTVERLAAVAGLGPRGIQRLFREHVGASPKWVIRRHRLQEVALRLERGEPTTLAALAATLGYADQAHLARDFKNAVGKSPREFAALMRE